MIRKRYARVQFSAPDAVSRSLVDLCLPSVTDPERAVPRLDPTCWALTIMWRGTEHHQS